MPQQRGPPSSDLDRKQRAGRLGKRPSQPKMWAWNTASHANLRKSSGASLVTSHHPCRCSNPDRRDCANHAPFSISSSMMVQRTGLVSSPRYMVRQSCPLEVADPGHPGRNRISSYSDTKAPPTLGGPIPDLYPLDLYKSTERMITEAPQAAAGLRSMPG